MGMYLSELIEQANECLKVSALCSPRILWGVLLCYDSCNGSQWLSPTVTLVSVESRLLPSWQLICSNLRVIRSRPGERAGLKEAVQISCPEIPAVRLPTVCFHPRGCRQEQPDGRRIPEREGFFPSCITRNYRSGRYLRFPSIIRMEAVSWRCPPMTTNGTKLSAGAVRAA